MHEAVREHMARIGRKGGAERSRRMSDLQRVESARHAAKARWAGHVKRGKRKGRKAQSDLT